jgi:hypothetical protein
VEIVVGKIGRWVVELNRRKTGLLDSGEKKAYFLPNPIIIPAPEPAAWKIPSVRPPLAPLSLHHQLISKDMLK